jgi:thiol-disulfide isomerase/thioredoxin
VVVAVIAVGVLLGRDSGPAAATPSAAASGAVAFTGTDVATGKAFDLAQLAGKPVVINIWASWCPGCNAEAHALARFAEAHPEAGFVGVNFQDSESAARSFYDEYDWKFPSVFDPQGDVSFSLGLQGTPTTIFLDAQHREVARIVGETDEAGFADGLEQATSGT